MCVISLFALASITKSGWIVGIATLLLSGGLYYVLPLAAQPIMYMIAVFGFAVTLYSIFRGKDNQ